MLYAGGPFRESRNRSCRLLVRLCSDPCCALRVPVEWSGGLPSNVCRTCASTRRHTGRPVISRMGRKNHESHLLIWCCRVGAPQWKMPTAPSSTLTARSLPSSASTTVCTLVHDISANHKEIGHMTESSRSTQMKTLQND